MALEHGLQFLLPSSECRKRTPKCPAGGQTELVQGWCYLWEETLYHTADPGHWRPGGALELPLS